MGNRNAAGGRGGSHSLSMFRTARAKGKSRWILSRLTGRKPRMTKMQIAIARGRFIESLGR
jgi:hypothetical protein